MGKYDPIIWKAGNDHFKAVVDYIVTDVRDLNQKRDKIHANHPNDAVDPQSQDWIDYHDAYQKLMDKFRLGYPFAGMQYPGKDPKHPVKCIMTELLYEDPKNEYLITGVKVRGFVRYTYNPTYYSSSSSSSSVPPLP